MVRRGRISTHTLRMERDYWLFWDVLLFFMFQSTRSAWSATPGRAGRMVPPMISIHALRMERDRSPAPAEARLSHFNPRAPHGARQGRHENGCGMPDFNPRAPHGARPGEIFEKAAGQKFQSTRSAWSATTYLQDKAVSD